MGNSTFSPSSTNRSKTFQRLWINYKNDHFQRMATIINTSKVKVKYQSYANSTAQLFYDISESGQLPSATETDL